MAIAAIREHRLLKFVELVNMNRYVNDISITFIGKTTKHACIRPFEDTRGSNTVIYRITERTSCLKQCFVKISDTLLKQVCSLRSWRDFARESFCFDSEAVNESGEAVRGLVKSPVEEFRNFTRGFAACEIPRGLYGGSAAARSPAHVSRQLRRLQVWD